jgi:hypothetical protein
MQQYRNKSISNMRGRKYSKLSGGGRRVERTECHLDPGICGFKAQRSHWRAGITRGSRNLASHGPVDDRHGISRFTSSNRRLNQACQGRPRMMDCDYMQREHVGRRAVTQTNACPCPHISFHTYPNHIWKVRIYLDVVIPRTAERELIS